MATPTQLSAPEQDTLVKQIGLAMLRAAPRDWQRITASYRTVGRYHELDGEITLADGSSAEWVATHDIATLFGRLRSGMYREGRGTWSNARYTLEAPASYNLEYDREEPEWSMLPPSQAYADELRMFPRTDENVPEWLMRRLAGLGPERPGPRMRIARVFDGTGESGRPVINRPELDDDEQDRILEYLTAAPVALPGRGYDVDRLAATPEPVVPVGYHSDGVWIWAAAAMYYLEEYGLTPDQDLVEHIRANDYRVPEVSGEQLAAAKEHLTRNDPGPQQPAAMPAPHMPRTLQAPPVEPPARHSVPPEEGRNGMEATQVWEQPAEFGAGGGMAAAGAGLAAGGLAGAAAGAAGGSGGSSGGGSDHASDDADYNDPDYDAAAAHRQAQADVGTAYYRPVVDDDPAATDLRAGSAPPPPPPAPAAPTGGEPALQRLRDQLDELGVPSTEYRIGGPTKLGWALEEVPEGWRVGWYADALSDSSVFGDANDAAAFMLGKVLLEPNGRVSDEEASDEPDAGRHEAEDTDFAPLPVMTDEAPPKHQAEPEAHDAVETTSAFEPEEVHAPEDSFQDSYEDSYEDSFEDEPPAREPSTRPDLPAPGLGGAGLGGAGLGGAGLGGAALGGAGLAGAAAGAGPLTGASPASSGGLQDHQRADSGLQDHQQPGGPHPDESVSEVDRPAVPRAAEPPPAPARPPSSGAPSAPGNWPIQPLPGEPPLTLFRGKHLVDLPPGSELDRFGGTEGNLTYAAKTPFEQRSLVPEWVNRPYHLYRVQRPIEALTGTSIPWFNQPGGGAAYILPASIDELLAEGTLIELEPGEVPID